MDKFILNDRYELLSNFDKGKFMSFLNHDYNGKILNLLDGEGLAILKKTSNKEDIIRYILAYSSYADDLFENEEFMNIFLDSKVNDYSAVLGNLDYKTYDMILDKCNNEKYSQNLNYLFVHFDLDYQIKAIKNWKYGIKNIYDILIQSGDKEIIEYILNNYRIDLSNYSYHVLSSLFNKIRSINYKENNTMDKHINFPSTLITKEVASILCSEKDIFELRETINTLGEITNNEVVEKYLEQLEDSIINFDIANNIYEIVVELSQIHLNWNDYKEESEKYKRQKELSSKLDSIYSFFGNGFSHEISNVIRNSNSEELKDKLQNVVKKLISNYIIDYHFKDSNHNVITDIKELVNFEKNGHINIDATHLEIYHKLINIDKLSFEEQKELHKELKHYDMNAMFYDDMRFARDIVNQAIKDYSISSESIKQYRDEVLSKKYGVDVYKIDDHPFFAIVKTGRKMDYFPAGHSFSLIGHNGVVVYKQSLGDTYLYDSSELNPEQVVHVFPFDSFTYYHPLSGSKQATESANSLLMPEELIGYSNGESYNEVLLYERGEDETPIDKRIPYLKKIALYCLDEIKEEDVEKAKKSGVGIFLIDSSKIEHDGKYKRDGSMHNDNYDYYSILSVDRLEARR